MSAATTASNLTPAQEEFQDFLSKNEAGDSPRVHPEDRHEAPKETDQSDDDDDDRLRNQKIEAAMRVPAMGDAGEMRLPPASFDSGCATGVKGVIADARAYEEARQSKWKSTVRAARQSVLGLGAAMGRSTGAQSGSDDDVDDAWIEQWRETRRQQMESVARGAIRKRRTSPSMRMFGHLDSVDAGGYLDAIEKVGRETVVVVFVYDHEVSHVIESALRPMVSAHPYIHFVRVHYDDLEFDNAAVPAVLAYKNQGDLFANLTGLIDMIPEDDDFDAGALEKLFHQHGVL